MEKCDSYHMHGTKPVCYSTKEMEECSCGGDIDKCTFYAAKRCENRYLLPCPFCGGDAELVSKPHIPNGTDWTPRCRNTSCCGRLTKKYTDKDTAITFWNRRA